MNMDNIHSLSYVKANASRLLEEVEHAPVVITKNGEAKAVLQGVQAYQECQDTLALLRIIAMGQQDIDSGRTFPMEDVFTDIRKRAAE